MRRWRSSATSLLVIGMLFWVGSAMSSPTQVPPEEHQTRLLAVTPPVAAIELLPWPADCWSPAGDQDCDSPGGLEPTIGDDTWRPLIDPAPAGWRSLVAQYFRPGDVERALRIIECESSGNADAVNPGSGASGLFQHLPRYWKVRAASAGFAGFSSLDPEANIAASAGLVYHGGGWSHWSASARCWR
ncbi:MAG: transglycosylase family protein [Acidimicrobiia bacterium]|nr:transglycosylase family protein [Acidimicrobiia bacterium]